MGRIIKIAGGKIIERAKQNIIYNSGGTITNNAAKKVIQIGKEGGVSYGDFEPFDFSKKETKTGGINTRFYDEQGQQSYEIPQKLHKAFNEEYGIKLAYNKEEEMLYYNGDCEPAYEKVSPTAIEYWKRELNPETISKGKLLFGYDFAYETYSASKDKNGNTYDKEGNLLIDFHTKKYTVVRGVVPGYRKVIKNYKYEDDGSVGDKIWDIIGNMACIDLGDYDDKLLVRGIKYELHYSADKYEAFKLEIPKLTSRYIGLPRVLEHEFIGHVLLKLTDDNYKWNSIEEKTLGPNPVEGNLGNVIRREIGLPDRKNYGDGLKMNKLDDSATKTTFGYLNFSKEPHPEANYDNIDKDSDYAFFGPPPKFPNTEGYAIINERAYSPLLKINYIVQIKFDGTNETFDFS